MDPVPARDVPTMPPVGGDAGAGKANPTCPRQNTDLAVVMQSLRAMAQDRDAIYIANQVGLVRIDKQSDETTEIVLPFIPQTIATDGEFLYLEDHRHGDGGWRSSIHRMSKGSTAPDAVLWRDGIRVSGLVASNGEVFFIENDGLRRVSSHVPTQFDTVEEPVRSFSVDDDSVYALSGRSIVRRARATGERQVLATEVSGELLGVAAGYLYLWDEEQWSIQRLSVQGGGVELVARVDGLEDGEGNHFVVDPKGIYVANYESALYWVDLRGALPARPMLVAHGDHYDDDDFDTVVLEDEGYVYWVVGGPPGDTTYSEGGVVIVKRCRTE
jgi:hypothetical protein